MNQATDIITIGQRIHCMLYGGKNGIIVAIHGKQTPESIGSMSGVISYGGSADFDVIWDDGSTSFRTPECIIRGVQWRFLDGIATSDQILDAVDRRKMYDAHAQAKEAAESARIAVEKEQHMADNANLLKYSDKPEWGTGRRAAENIRRALKVAFPTIKFSVKSDHSSINIRWTDGPTSRMVGAITDRHQSGYFDGMDDCYKSTENAFGDIFGSVRFVSNHRDDSLIGYRAAWEQAGHDAADIPDDYMEAGGNDNPCRDHIFRTWSDCDLTSSYVTPIKPKGPQFTADGNLACKYGYTRHFKKTTTAEREADKLRKKGQDVKVDQAAGHYGFLFIRKV